MSKSPELDQKLIDECRPIHSVWNELTKTWTLPVIHTLGLQEPARFNELKRRITGISATSLAERLNDLEKTGVVERKVLPESPPRVEYSLTKKGIELHGVLCQLASWVNRWEEQEAVVPKTAPPSSK